MTVDEWFEDTKNPMSEVMQAVRRIIMAEPDVTEVVKYRARAFQSTGLSRLRR